jgi:hypothetical protein
MQQATPTPHSWADLIYLALAAILGYGATYLPSLLRKRQSDAETEKTKAETRQIDLNTTIHAGDVMLGLIREIATSTSTIETLRKERDFQFDRAEVLKIEKGLLEKQLDDIIRVGKNK